MNKKIILVGKSQSGKTYFAEELEKLGLHKAVTTTTRPMRGYEINGTHYNFISKTDFEEKIENNLFLEYDNFNDWYYGVPKDEFEKSDIIILTPSGVNEVLKTLKNRRRCIVIYLETSINLRKQRNNDRNDTHDSIGRRWMNDDIDFETFENYGGPWDLKISIQNNDTLIDFIKILTDTIKAQNIEKF